MSRKTNEYHQVRHEREMVRNSLNLVTGVRGGGGGGRGGGGGGVGGGGGGGGVQGDSARNSASRERLSNQEEEGGGRNFTWYLVIPCRKTSVSDRN